MLYGFQDMKKGRIVRIQEIWTDRKASVAVTFLLLILPVLLSVGLAIDTWRMVDGRQMMQDMVDNVALTGAGAYSDKDQGARAVIVAGDAFTQQQALLPGWIKATLSGVGENTGPDPRKLTANSYNVTVQATATMQLYFMPLFNKFFGGKGAAEQIDVLATASNPFIEIDITPTNENATADDWDAVYAYAIPRDGATGAWDYNTIPSVPSVQAAQVFNNCKASVVSKTPYYNPTSSTFTSRCNGAAGWNNVDQSTITAINSTTISATQRIGFILLNETAGNDGPAVNDLTNWTKDAGEWSATLSYPGLPRTVPIAYPNDFTYPYGYVGQYGERWGDMNYFYSSYAAMPQSPASSVDDSHGKATFYTEQPTPDSKSVPTPAYYASPADYAAGNLTKTTLSMPMNGAGDAWTQSYQYPRTYHGNMNCSLQVTLTAGGSLPVAPPMTGNCTTLGSGDTAYLYGNPSCAQAAGDTFSFWWNDMGDIGLDLNTADSTYGYVMGDNYNYTDAVYTVKCSNGGGPTSVFLSK